VQGGSERSDRCENSGHAVVRANQDIFEAEREGAGGYTICAEYK
jgi:hypothetical protein